jgi:putative hydrolase of the HAD superfamily
MTLLALLKRGIKLAVVSDAPSREAWLRLCYLNLQHVFDVVVTFEDTGQHKPSPAPFLRALTGLQVDAREALMIGDWPERDVVGAATLGITTVFARYGDTFGTVHSGATYEVDDISELLTILDRENGTAGGAR